MIALTGKPNGGTLSAAIEHASNPSEPIEAHRLTRRLMERYPGQMYVELAFHADAAEKLVNRGRIAIAQPLELPLVAVGGTIVRPWFGDARRWGFGMLLMGGG